MKTLKQIKTDCDNELYVQKCTFVTNEGATGKQVCISIQQNQKIHRNATVIIDKEGINDLFRELEDLKEIL